MSTQPTWAAILATCIPLLGCPKQPPTPAPPPPEPTAKPAPEPAPFSPTSVGANWTVQLENGAVSPSTDSGDVSAIELLFFQDLLEAEDYQAGRYCRLSYPVVDSDAAEGLLDAWATWTVQTDAPTSSEGQCDQHGSWGTTPHTWVMEQRIEVGVGPISEATLSHLEPLWAYYEPVFGGPLSTVAPTLVEGSLHLDGRVHPHWGFGHLSAEGDTAPEPSEPPGAGAIAEGQWTGRVLVMGMRPYAIEAASTDSQDTPEGDLHPPPGTESASGEPPR